MTMANCHSSIKNPDTMGAGDGSSAYTTPPRPRPYQYSVNNLVEGIHRLEKLCWYVPVLWRILVFLFRWESPFVTLSFWITSLLICYFMKSGQILASCLGLLFLLAGSGRFVHFKLQEHRTPLHKTKQSNSTASIASSTTQGTEPSHTEIELQQKKGREVLAEYRQLMLTAQDWLTAACDMLETVHGVLSWQHATWSPVFYGGSAIVLVLLCLLPLRWVVMATMSSILCLNPDFVELLRQVFNLMHEDEKEETDTSRALPQRESNDKPAAQAEPPIRHDIQHRPLHLCQKSKSLDEAGPNYARVVAANRNRSSTAPELPTLKLNSGGLPEEVCFLCGAMFSSVLKRRRYCRSCGNQFCQRCCSRKLPRVVFGATSPAALTEKELVCNTCYCTMTADDPTQLSGGTTIEER